MVPANSVRSVANLSTGDILYERVLYGFPETYPGWHDISFYPGTEFREGREIMNEVSREQSERFAAKYFQGKERERERERKRRAPHLDSMLRLLMPL